MATARFTSPNSPTKLEIARKWLRDELVSGEVYRASEVQERAIEAGIKRRTLQLAATYEVDISKRYGAQGVQAWEWKLKV